MTPTDLQAYIDTHFRGRIGEFSEAVGVSRQTVSSYLSGAKPISERMVKAVRALETVTERDKLAGHVTRLRTVLQQTVDVYGQPGGPWNVPREPGTWIANAKKVLKETR